MPPRLKMSTVLVSVPNSRGDDTKPKYNGDERVSKRRAKGSDKFGLKRQIGDHSGESLGKASDGSSTDKIIVPNEHLTSKEKKDAPSTKGAALAVAFVNRVHNLKVKSLDPGNLSASDSETSASTESSTPTSSSSSTSSEQSQEGGRAESLPSSTTSTTSSSTRSVSSTSTRSSDGDTGEESARYWSRVIPPSNPHNGPVQDEHFTALSSFLHRVVPLAPSPQFTSRPPSAGSPWGSPLNMDPFRNHPAFYVSEPAVVYEWNSQFASWTPRNTRLVVGHMPFAEGAMRASYYAVDLAAPQALFVAKRYRKKRVRSSQYFNDASMHWVSNHWADMFNSYNPPKPVQFVPAAVAELTGRNCGGRTFVLGIEPYLAGKFRKYNNNNGFVATSGSNIQRSTPQAFSHFTYHYSCGELMIVDIQGVGDAYTDPQLLTTDGEGYGRGNLGRAGMKKFFKTHKCNAVCGFLHLPDMGRMLKKAMDKRHSTSHSIGEDLTALLGSTSSDSQLSTRSSTSSESSSAGSSSSDDTSSERSSVSSPHDIIHKVFPLKRESLGATEPAVSMPTEDAAHIHKLAVASRFWDLFKNPDTTSVQSPTQRTSISLGRAPSMSVRDDPSAHLPQTLMRINPLLGSSVDSLHTQVVADRRASLVKD